MEISYWQARWEKGHIGWHMEQVYPNLPDFWPQLQLKAGSTVLVPLCGKSLDLIWLASKNHKVIGVEVSKEAVEQFFREHGIAFQKASKASFNIYQSENLDIWIGDFFKMKPQYLPNIDAVYDKAALIALPPVKRKQYARSILNFCNPGTQMLLNAFEYNQEEMNGPPFAVFKHEIIEYYRDQFEIHLLHEESLFDKLSNFQRRGLSSYLTEKLYHLIPD